MHKCWKLACKSLQFMTMQRLVLVAHNVRSAHNVGSLLRSAEALGAEKVYLSGYSPYPRSRKDTRLPHKAQNAHNKISKTALGAENLVRWEYCSDLPSLINDLRNKAYVVAALEQVKKSLPIYNYQPSGALALIVGSEIGGLDSETLKMCDIILEIPMEGSKESLNVSVAAAIAIYQLKYIA